jgi:hypothetical protein
VGNDEGAIDLVNDPTLWILDFDNHDGSHMALNISNALDVGKVQASTDTVYGEGRNIYFLILRNGTG